MRGRIMWALIAGWRVGECSGGICGRNVRRITSFVRSAGAIWEFANTRSRGSPAGFRGRPTGSCGWGGARPPDPGAVKCPRVVGSVPAPASGETPMSVLTQLLELGTLHHLCETPALRAELRGKLTP